MIVYVLLCYYGHSTEMHGVFDSALKAAQKAAQMEQADQVEIGQWTVKAERIQ